MRSRIVLAVFVFGYAASITAEPLAQQWQKRISAIELNYEAGKVKAEDARVNALAKVQKDRLAALKKVLSDATKAGDFNAATEVKARLDVAEKDGVWQTKPSNVEKFGGHEYAFFLLGSNWHAAKRKCEQMGGHLITIESPRELEFLNRLCEKKHIVWLGACDHEKDDHYVWLNGSPFNISQNVELDRDTDGAADALCYHASSGMIKDWYSGGTLCYVCEWD